MKDENETKDELINELVELRQRITELEISETQRKQAEKALREERDKVKKYLDVAGIIFLVLDTDQRVTLINKKGCEILEHSEKEIIGKNWYDNFVPKEIKDEAKGAFQKLMTGEIKRTEFSGNPILTKSGKERIITWQDIILKDKAGSIIGMLSSGEDITERKRAEEVLKESEAKYSALIKQAKDGVFILQDEIFKFANGAMGEISGYAVEEIVGMSFLKMFAPECRALIAQRYRLRMAGKESTPLYETKIQCKDGTIKEVEISTGSIQYQQRLAVMTILRDITKRKQEEEKIRELSQFQKIIIDNANVWLDVLDKEANVVVWNKAAEKISGYSRKEVVGHNKVWKWLYPDEDYRKKITAKAAAIIEKGNVVENFEMTIRCKNGQTKIISWNSRNLKDKSGVLIGSIALGHDITEHKQSKEKIKHLNLMLRAIRNVNQLIAREKNREILLKGICDNFVEVRGYKHAWLALLDEFGKFTMAIESSLGKNFLPMLEQMKHNEFPNCIRRVLMQPEVIIIENSSSTCRDCPLADKINYLVRNHHPLQYDEKIYGLLSVSLSPQTDR